MTSPRVLALYFPNRLDLRPLAEACLQLSPKIAIRENEAIFLDISGLSKITTFDRLLLRLRAILKRFSLEPILRWGNSCAEALALAKYKVSYIQELPAQAAFEYQNPFFSDPIVERRFKLMLVTLNRLGLQTLQSLRRLPPAEVVSRFGESAMEFYQSLLPHHCENWPHFHVRPTIEESTELPDMPFQSSNALLEPLIFVIRGLVERVMARLRGRGERVLQLELILEQEKFSTVNEPIRTWKFTFSTPQGGVQTLLAILQERLSHEVQKKPLESSVQKLSLLVTEVTHGATSQMDFICRREQMGESWHTLLARLQTRLGRENVFFAEPQSQLLPERTFQKVIWKTQELTADLTRGPVIFDQLPIRPTRLLKQPLQIFYQNGLFWEPKSGEKWRVLKTDGPERFDVEWWNTRVQRDYYQVMTDQNKLLWLYFDRAHDRFFLHGYFD